MSAIMNFFANFRFNNNIHVVIVGAGYAGVEAATSLDSSFRVTLIEATDSHNHKIASLRAAVMPGWEKRIRLPLDGLLKNGQVLQSKVSAVESGRVTLADQSILECDYVILAHGKGSVNFPCGKKARFQQTNFTSPVHKKPQHFLRLLRRRLGQKELRDQIPSDARHHYSGSVCAACGWRGCGCGARR